MSLWQSCVLIKWKKVLDLPARAHTWACFPKGSGGVCFTLCLAVRVALWRLLLLPELLPVRVTEEAEDTQMSDLLWWRLVGGAARPLMCSCASWQVVPLALNCPVVPVVQVQELPVFVPRPVLLSDTSHPNRAVGGLFLSWLEHCASHPHQPQTRTAENSRASEISMLVGCYVFPLWEQE